MTAPIALFCYNRPAHLKQTLDALQANELAAQSPLYVFCDGPKDGVLTVEMVAVRELVGSVTGFASVVTICREENFGCRRSLLTGVTEILNRHGRVIVVEDDIVTSPHFLRYMNDALEHYERDPHVFSIGAYNFPRKTMNIPASYAFDAYAVARNCSWGWGVWADRWALVDWDMPYFEDFVRQPALREAFDTAGPDLSRMLADQYAGRSDAWDIQFCYAHFLHNMRCIYPVRSFTRNIGLDNTGTHCGTDPRREHDSLEPQRFPLRFCPGDAVEPEIARQFYNACSHYRRFPAMRRARRAVAAAWDTLRRKAKTVIFRPQALCLLTVNSFWEGGAAKAAWRNFRGISRHYPDARFLTLFKAVDNPAVVGLEKTGSVIANKFARRDRRLLKRYPSYRKETFFSPGVRRTPVRIPVARFRPDIVHLNWIAGGMMRLEELLDLDCPIVWTLHDTWAFTGGCHYVGDCHGYEGRCGHCGVLGSTRKHDLSYELMRRKLCLYPRLDLTLVTPSRWLAELARRSAAFGLNRIEVIPNGLDLSVFRPLDHREAKRYFDVPEDSPVALFGSLSLADPRKGGDLLRAALSEIRRPCTLLTFGDGRLELPDCPHITTRSLGLLHDDQSLALAYSAADVFCCPSREDNFPNTVLEAMSCGTPCLAFDAGGLPEMIDHRTNGFLAQAYSAQDMAAGLEWLFRHPEPGQLRQAARRKAEESFGLDLMTERYYRLFEELKAQKRHAPREK